MRSLLIYMLCSMSIATSSAQTFSEWFQQKEMQEKYLVQQLIGLEVYANYLKKGYQTIDKSAKTISSIKNGDFQLHELFFDSQRFLNPNMSRQVDGLEIQPLQRIIHQYIDRTDDFNVKDRTIGLQERTYFRKVLKNVRIKERQLANYYDDLAKDNNLEMSDEPRLERLKNLKMKYLSIYEFVRYFEIEVKGCAQQLKNKQREISNSKKLLGLK